MVSSLKALRSSGRLSQTWATWPWRWMSSVGMFMGCSLGSHAEHAKARFANRRVQAGTQAQGQHAPCVRRADHAIVPQAGRGVIGMTLLLVLLADGGFEGGFLVRAPLAALALDAVTLDRGQHAGGLFAAHHADARVGPHPQKTRIERAPAH